jgi:hypothetical protein
MVDFMENPDGKRGYLHFRKPPHGISLYGVVNQPFSIIKNHHLVGTPSETTMIQLYEKAWNYHWLVVQ